MTDYVCLVRDGTVNESTVTRAATIEEVAQFSYLGDVLGCGGGAETSVRHRKAIAWSKLTMEYTSQTESTGV